MSSSTSANSAGDVLDLVRAALDELESGAGHVARAARKAVRAARLIGDWEAVYWIQQELNSHVDREAQRRLMIETAAHLSRDQLKALRTRSIEHSISSRQINTLTKELRVKTEDMVMALSIDEVEALIGQFDKILNEEPVSAAGGAQLVQASFSHGELTKVLDRIRNRLHEYLSQLERRLVNGARGSAAVVHQRAYVDSMLPTFAPDAAAALMAASERAHENSLESWSQALTSIRRTLKAFADAAYPPRAEPVVGPDGVSRKMTDAHFKNRLWQFISESGANSASRDLLQADLVDLGDRVDNLNDLASKGVHAAVTEFEVDLCMSSTYTLLRSLLLLHTQQSAAQAALPAS